MGFKKGWAAYKRAKGGKKGRSKAGKKGKKGVRSRAKSYAKGVARRAYSRPFTFVDNVLATVNMLGPVFEAWKWKGKRGQHLISSYTGLLFDDGWGYRDFEAKRLARGYAPLLTSVLYKKQMGYLNKMAPVKGMVPKSIGEVRNIATNVIGRIGAFSAVQKGMEAGTNSKLTNYTRNFTQNYSGIDLNHQLDYYGWNDYRLYRGQAPFMGAIVFHKGTSLMTKHLKGGFKLPRL